MPKMRVLMLPLIIVECWAHFHFKLKLTNQVLTISEQHRESRNESRNFFRKKSHRNEGGLERRKKRNVIRMEPTIP